MIFVCYKTCSTCQKAKQWLLDNGIDFDERDIKEQRPSEKELSIWYKTGNLTLKNFFNTSGLLYKALELKNQLPTMSEGEQLRLLASDGMLVKRPILITNDNKVLVGFKPDEWKFALNI